MYSISMQLLVKLLRRHGALIPREEVEAAPWVAVTVLTDSNPKAGRRLAMWPEGHGGHAGADGALRELFGVSLREVEADRMVLRGIERCAGPRGEPAAVLQEWMLKPVPELGSAGWHSPVAKQFTRDAGLLVDPVLRSAQR